MKLVGALLMLMGGAIALFAFMMDTTVTSGGALIAGTFVGGGSTYNLGLLQRQMMVFQSGLAAFVAGAFLYGSGGRDVKSVEARSDYVSAPGDWKDVQPGETEEERDERVGRSRRQDLIIFGALIALIAIVTLVAWPRV